MFTPVILPGVLLNMNTENYQISLPQFEGPFDLLLFFIERDELDIYNIPITKITNEFLEFIHKSEALNIELSSEFILFISTLMRIKAKMLLPRKELDALGNEIDPRNELIDKILEYKKFKQAAIEMSELEALRMLSTRRGNLKQELLQIGEHEGEGTEIQTISLYKLMKAFERIARRLHEKRHQPVHTVMQYNYTMEGSRKFVLELIERNRSLQFEKIIGLCENRLHAIFLFLNMLELIQQKYLTITMGEGMNNFILEFNENRVEDAA